MSDIHSSVAGIDTLETPGSQRIDKVALGGRRWCAAMTIDQGSPLPDRRRPMDSQSNRVPREARLFVTTRARNARRRTS